MLILIKLPGIKFRENPFSGFRVICGETEKQMDGHNRRIFARAPRVSILETGCAI
jgi:hypothetical protein